jgi:hypothetical protein
MGQAKKRGDFETRKAQSIENQRLALEKAEREAKEWFDGLTDEQQEQYRAEIRRREKAMGELGAMLGVLTKF